MQVIKHFGKTTHKAVAVQVGKFTVLFDPGNLTFVDAWEGGLVKWNFGALRHYFRSECRRQTGQE